MVVYVLYLVEVVGELLDFLSESVVERGDLVLGRLDKASHSSC